MHTLAQVPDLLSWSLNWSRCDFQLQSSSFARQNRHTKSEAFSRNHKRYTRVEKLCSRPLALSRQTPLKHWQPLPADRFVVLLLYRRQVYLVTNYILLLLLRLNLTKVKQTLNQLHETNHHRPTENSLMPLGRDLINIIIIHNSTEVDNCITIRPTLLSL